MPDYVGSIDYRRAPAIGVRSDFTTYYCSPCVNPGAGVATMVANRLYYQPIYLPNQVVDRIGIDVTTGAAGACRLGLYTSTNINPSTLILDCGTVDTTSIATVEATFTATTLPADWVWLAAVFNATPAVRSGGVAYSPHILGLSGTTAASKGLLATFTYGSLPSTATAPTQHVTNTPVIYLRKS